MYYGTGTYADREGQRAPRGATAAAGLIRLTAVACREEAYTMYAVVIAKKYMQYKM